MSRDSHIQFELTDQENVDRLGEYVTRILESLGFTDSLVTDESMISDFLCITLTPDEQASQLRDLSAKLGVPVSIHDYLWQVAERLK